MRASIESLRASIDTDLQNELRGSGLRDDLRASNSSNHSSNANYTTPGGGGGGGYGGGGGEYGGGRGSHGHYDSLDQMVSKEEYQKALFEAEQEKMALLEQHEVCVGVFEYEYEYGLVCSCF
jgi:hypothetical protein